jgi:RND family efflux transporter MFP subunit
MPRSVLNASPRSLLTAGLIVLAWTLATSGWGCGRRDTPAAAAAPAPVAVTLVPVQRVDVPRTVEITGTIFATEDVAVAAKVSGRIISLGADLGDVRSSGDVLAQVDPKDAELALNEREAQLSATLAKLGLSSIPDTDVDFSSLPAVRRAQAEAANAQARYERAKRLHDQQPPLIADQDFADVRTQWDVAARGVETEILAAKATLADARALVAATDTARQVLKDTRIVVPSFDKAGPTEFRIAARSVSVGELVAPGRVLFRVVATERVKFRGSVPERFAGSVIVGQGVNIQVAGFEQPFPGKVTRISPAINPSTRSFDVEVLADNPQGSLKPGAFARAVITVRREPDVHCIPITAVIEFAGVQRIFAVKDGKAMARVIRTGQRLGDLVELVGLKDPPETVIDRPGNLREGAPVTAQ